MPVPATLREIAAPVAHAAAGVAGAAAVVSAAALVVAGLTAPPAAVDVTAAAPLSAATFRPAAELTAAPSAAATPAPTAAPTAAATAAPTAAPSAAPTAAPPSIATAPYRSGGRAYTGLTVAAGTELRSPLAGRAEVRVYQLINGEIRTGANVASLPYFPYVLVRASDGRVLTLRPGALGSDSEVLVESGQAVGAGTPLVRVTGSGPSSWRTFYDASVPFQVVASLVAANGTDLDAAALFR